MKTLNPNSEKVWVGWSEGLSYTVVVDGLEPFQNSPFERSLAIDTYFRRPHPPPPVASRQGPCWPVCHIYQVIFQFSRKVEKSGAIISDFFQLFHKKVDLLVLNTSNTIPSKSLRLILTNFMT